MFILWYIQGDRFIGAANVAAGRYDCIVELRMPKYGCKII